VGSAGPAARPDFRTAINLSEVVVPGSNQSGRLTSAARAPTEPNRWAVLALLGTAQLMVVLDSTIVNIALPSAQRALHFSTSDREWIVTAQSGSKIRGSACTTPQAFGEALVTVRVDLGADAVDDVVTAPPCSSARTRLTRRRYRAARYGRRHFA
jgi:hypothetical protein